MCLFFPVITLGPPAPTHYVGVRVLTSGLQPSPLPRGGLGDLPRTGTTVELNLQPGDLVTLLFKYKEIREDIIKQNHQCPLIVSTWEDLPPR